MTIPDFKKVDGLWALSKRVSGRTLCTFSGLKWRHMIERCTPGSHAQRANPSYVGCTVEFSSFDEFAGWHQLQVGYGEFEIDKDLMVPGNKIYSPATCILLPRVINKTLVGGRRHESGDLPPGVYKIKSCPRYEARGNSTGYLGIFETAEEAHQAYLTAKRERLRALADEYRDRLDPRAYEALYAR